MINTNLTLRHIIKRQRAFSLTNREGILLALRRVIWCVIYLLKGFLVGFRALKTEQLGSRVIYDGKLMFVSNWANTKAPTLSGNGLYLQDVPRADVRNVLDIREVWHRFLFGLDWYLSYWHDIDVNKRLYK